MAEWIPLTDPEEINISGLTQYLQTAGPDLGKLVKVSRFTGGYSNLSYLLETDKAEYVLRRPPAGANIRTAHDMGRECKVLSLLRPHFAKVPTLISYCEAETIIGAPFYIMEKMPGTILRAGNAPGRQIPPGTFHKLSAALVDNLVALHSINIEATGLIQLGKPDGYVQRQVSGWIKRYFTAETDKISAMDAVAEWLPRQEPKEQSPTLLHNDYKYDNLLLNPDDLTEITGVLDWEMATVGDPLMDVGASLAYWFEAEEAEVFRQYNLSWLPGNYSRKEWMERYALQSGRDLSDIGFYYVFGLFKNAVIAQQIYHRWKHGNSTDKRFGALLPMIQLLGTYAAKAVEKGTL